MLQIFGVPHLSRHRLVIDVDIDYNIVVTLCSFMLSSIRKKEKVDKKKFERYSTSSFWMKLYWGTEAKPLTGLTGSGTSFI